MLIQPQIHQAANGKRVAIFYWDKEVDEELLKALQRGENLRTHVAGGLHESSYGSVAWFICAIDTQKNIELAETGDDLFCFDFLPNPATMINLHPLSLWIDLLEEQGQLLLCINAQRTYTMNLASGEGLRQWIAKLRMAANCWQPTNDFVEAAKATQRVVNGQRQEALTILKRQFVASHKEQLLQSCASRILSDLPRDCQLYKAAFEGNLSAINDYLLHWSSKLPKPPLANAILAEYSEDPVENICRDFVFALECYQPTFRNKSMLAVGTTDSGSWWWRDVPKGDLSAIWLLSRQYRMLLRRRQWQFLYEPNDILIGELTPLSLESLAQVPIRQQFSEAKRILVGATLHQEYPVRPLSRVVLGCKGFESVTFYPVKRDLCLFKILSYERAGWQHCLLGELNPIEGFIQLVGQQVTQSNTPVINLLLFLVAIAYRDLVVCVEGRYQQSSGGFVPRMPKNNSRKGKESSRKSSNLVIWLPRFQTRKNCRTAAESRALLESLRRLVPFRVEHIRKLPEGWLASPEQLQIAKDLGLQVPEGYTFVRRVDHLSEEGDVQLAIQKYKSLSLLELFLGE